MAEELKVIVTADDKASNVLKGIGGAITNIGKIALGAGVAGFAGLTAGIGASVKAAMEAEQIDAQLNAVLKSTGGVAGVTKDQVLKLSDSFSKLTTFEDDAITGGQNLLLTFTKIGKDVFPDATEVMLDMSQALGQDLKSSALQLGKALNDPTQGVSALQRVGVSFTDAQKEQIKTLVESGKTMEAQKLILAELKTEFGGAAKAAGETFAGQLEIAKNQIGNIAESIGTLFLPKLTELAKEANEKVIPALAGVFPALQEGWDKNDWTKLAGTLNLLFPQDVSENIATLIGRIADGVKTGNWEPVKQQLWAMFQSGISYASDQILIEADKVLDAFNAWAQSEDARKQMQDIGSSVGRGVVDGIIALITGAQAKTEMGQAIVDGLRGAIEAIPQVISDIGAGVAEGFLTGLFAKITGQEVADEMKQKLRDLFSAAIQDASEFAKSIFNPLSMFQFFASTFPGMPKLPGFQTAPGEFRVVPGGMNEAVPALVHGGEIVGRPSLGSGVVVNLTYAPALSLADEREFQERLMPFIERGITNARFRQVGASR